MKKPILETGQVYKSPVDDWSSEVVGEYDAASRQTSSLSVCLSVCLSLCPQRALATSDAWWSDRLTTKHPQPPYCMLPLRRTYMTAIAVRRRKNLFTGPSFWCFSWCFFCLCNCDVLCTAFGRNK